MNYQHKLLKKFFDIYASIVIPILIVINIAILFVLSIILDSIVLKSICFSTSIVSIVLFVLLLTNKI